MIFDKFRPCGVFIVIFLGFFWILFGNWVEFSITRGLNQCLFQMFFDLLSLGFLFKGFVRMISFFECFFWGGLHLRDVFFIGFLQVHKGFHLLYGFVLMGFLWAFMMVLYF